MKKFFDKTIVYSSLHRNIAKLHEKQTLTEYSFCVRPFEVQKGEKRSKIYHWLPGSSIVYTLHKY